MARSKRESTFVTDVFSEQLNKLVAKKKERGMTQKSIAEEIGISASQLDAYLCNCRTPTIDTFWKICEYFKVSADYMLTGVSSKNRNIAKDTGLSEKAIEQLRIFNSPQKIMYYSYPQHPENKNRINAVNLLLESTYGQLVLSFIHHFISDNIDSFSTANNYDSEKNGFSPLGNNIILMSNGKNVLEMPIGDISYLLLEHIRRYLIKTREEYKEGSKKDAEENKG